MSRPPCVFCARPGEHWHHLTGRPAPKAPYLDPDLVVALCRRHHAREHVLLADKALEWLPAGVDPLLHRLRRVVCFAERCADFHRAFRLEPPSALALAGLHDEALDALVCTDAGAP